MIASAAIKKGYYRPPFRPRNADWHSGVKDIKPVTETRDPSSPEPLIDAATTALLFAAMTWNVNLLEVLLVKAPNPLEHCVSDPPTETLPPIGAGAAFPSLEEAFRSGAGAGGTHKDRPTRSKRRKLGRRRGRCFPLAYIAEPACGEAAPGSDGIYLTEEEEVDAYQRAGCQPTDTARQSYSHANPDTESGKKDEEEKGKEQEGDTSGGETTGAFENLSDTGKSGEKSIRAFLRQFYQSFVLVMSAQVRHAACAEVQRDGHSLTAMELRALCFVQRYMGALKAMLRQYVMCSDTESSRRGAQPLLLDAFACESSESSSADWRPQHEQIYISGKEPVHQPLLLDALGITRIVQCYAERSGSNNGVLALNALQCWRRLLLEPETEQKGLFQSTEEWDTACAVITQSLASISWEPYSSFGPYCICTARLPVTNRRVAKLILPAEDRDTYDLSLHFQEGIFRFMHGSPLFPMDSVPGAVLVHCFAGMHRSSGIAIAYLLWLIAQSRGALPRDTQRGRTALCLSHGLSSQREPGSVSYLRAAQRNPPLVESADAVAEVTEKDTALHRCVAHVRRQRSVAVPIDAVQRQLAAYAAHLRLE